MVSEHNFDPRSSYYSTSFDPRSGLICIFFLLLNCYGQRKSVLQHKKKTQTIKDLITSVSNFYSPPPIFFPLDDTTTQPPCRCYYSAIDRRRNQFDPSSVEPFLPRSSQHRQGVSRHSRCRRTSKFQPFQSTRSVVVSRRVWI